MQIRKVLVSNFRGIREASWSLPDRRFVCLVGPGDSTKTTLLDVIGLVLSPRWNVPFTDADFYGGNIDEPIVLQVVMGDLPARLLSDDAQGYSLCGLKPTGELTEEPEDGTEACVMVQLKVTDTLEPVWTVVRPGREDEGGTINAGARADFGLFRVDDHIETHLRWGRGSALTRLTEKGPGAQAAVTSAHRAARKAVFGVDEDALHAAAAAVAQATGEIGGAAFTKLCPGLDPTSGSTTHALLLHDREIPLTGYGLGTRRLTSLAIQEKAFTSGEIVLVDEVEHGLEPHRLKHLLQHLKARTATHKGQVILTTHSPLAVESLVAEDISIVRCSEGTTAVQLVPSSVDNVQGTLRAAPSALLAKSIAVCEGKTEMGVVRRLIQHWDAQRHPEKASHASLGAAYSYGEGTSAPTRALVFRLLGFPTLLLADHDDPAIDATVAKVATKGGQIVRWEPGNALEQQIASSLSPAGLAEMVALAAAFKSEEAVRSAISARLPGGPALSGLDPSSWIAPGCELPAIRSAIGGAAKKNDWFKLEEPGSQLADLLISCWDEIKDLPLGLGFRKLYRFVYSEDTP